MQYKIFSWALVMAATFAFAATVLASSITLTKSSTDVVSVDSVGIDIVSMDEVLADARATIIYNHRHKRVRTIKLPAQ